MHLQFKNMLQKLFIVINIPNDALFCVLQYDYDIEDDSTRDSTRDSSCNNETSQDEMSSDETKILRAQKSRLNPSKKSASPFSRSSYVRRRAAKRPLPMSGLAKSSISTIVDSQQIKASNDACSSPSNTESGKENDVNFATADSKKTSVRKEQTIAASSTSLLPEMSSAIFVRDEFDSTGEDVLHLGKGKRKRFLNVRMFPIGETMSQKILELGGKKVEENTITPKKFKLDDENVQNQRRGSVDTLTTPTPNVDKRRKSVDKLNNVEAKGETQRKSIDKLNVVKTKVENRRKSENLPKRRSSAELKSDVVKEGKRRNSVGEKLAKIEKVKTPNSFAKKMKKSEKKNVSKDSFVQADEEITFKVTQQK